MRDLRNMEGEKEKGMKGLSAKEMKLETGFLPKVHASNKGSINMSVGFVVRNIPVGTQALAFVMIDKDYPAGQITEEYGKLPDISPFVHALSITDVELDQDNNPLDLKVPDGTLADKMYMLKTSYALFGLPGNCYMGPNPPLSHVKKAGKHTYEKRVLAIDTPMRLLDLTRDSDYAAFMKAIDGKVIDAVCATFKFGGNGR